MSEPQCNPHPKAPHGFDRNGSHSAGRYVCECEHWEPYDAGYQKGLQDGLERAYALQEISDIGQPQEAPPRREPLSDGWQPIETAPRYGRILVTGTEIGTCVASAGWDTETPEVVRWGVVNDVYVTPTHWMPLPPGTGDKT